MIKKNVFSFFCQQYQRSEREWSTLDGLSNVNETLILSNMPLYDVYLLFVRSLLSLSKVGLCFLLPLEKNALYLFSFSSFRSRSSHVTDTKAPNEFVHYTLSHMKFGNTQQFINLFGNANEWAPKRRINVNSERTKTRNNFSQTDKFK